MKDRIEEIKDVTACCVLDLMTLADVLNKLDMEEDSKQVAELAVQVCGHGRGAYHLLKEKCQN
ncbi:MAG: hypothetical protein AB1898_33180 [Acidobacteriota bacterium]